MYDLSIILLVGLLILDSYVMSGILVCVKYSPVLMQMFSICALLNILPFKVILHLTECANTSLTCELGSSIIVQCLQYFSPQVMTAKNVFVHL